MKIEDLMSRNTNVAHRLDTWSRKGSRMARNNGCTDICPLARKLCIIFEDAELQGFETEAKCGVDLKFFGNLAFGLMSTAKRILQKIRQDKSVDEKSFRENIGKPYFV